MVGEPKGKAAEYFKPYEEYSKVLRTWFVAFGIGAPVLLLTNERIAEAIKASGEARGVVSLFLLGVGLQVLIAALNKASMWSLYYGEVQNSFKGFIRYKVAYWFSEQFWIDFLVDASTMICFGVATFSAYEILVI